eukprot:CAMPEP_0168193122 /NCGR_PEP_ID=MMETSP0139_2-20121125/18425_1 /TAXON_ID=44445 /ORGANISM="Pseudo-nitzschia australis, Strain 10249 10 AB" /LENGTH=495 /DNA_ID=CAMNT_0008116431 /DNA_START=50 /DNA_END=1537 /DNA_ORIENTATION=-
MVSPSLCFTPFYLSLLLLSAEHGESLGPPELGRRDAIAKAAATAIAISVKPPDAKAAVSSVVGGDDASVSVAATGSTRGIVRDAILPSDNPPPILSLPIQAVPTATSTLTQNGNAYINIPRVGYSFYKTAPDKAERCAALALRSGVTHLDLATQYGSNAEIGKAIRTYVKSGRAKLAPEEKPELLDLLDASHRCQTTRMVKNSNINNNYGGKKRGGGAARRRREELFLSHKISNEEQSTDPDKIRKAVSDAIAALGVNYLDMVSIHSPLTNPETRLATYQALIDLQQGGGAQITKTSSSPPIVRSVGVCNYGLGPLKEIAAAGLPLPVVNQLELSPFNTHSDVVDYCSKNGIAVSCAAWSKLSGANGPSEQWDVLSRIASKKGVTKAQVMVRWSLQKGYICVPRSGSGSKLERVAIAENSYGGGLLIRNGKIPATMSSGSSNGNTDWNEDSAVLTPEEMSILDDLNINYKAGKLGRTDGWFDADMTGSNWDPTEI